MNCSECGAGLHDNARFCTSCGTPVREQSAIAPPASRGTRYGAIGILSIIGLGLAALGVVAALAAPFFIPLSPSAPVTVSEVQARLAADANLSKQFDALKAQFAHLNDEQWTEARDLIQTWVNDLGTTAATKSAVIEEIKKIAEGMAPEQRARAIDTYYILKREARSIEQRPLSSWLLQFATVGSLMFGLLVLGLFSLNLLLLDVARQIGGKELNRRQINIK